MKLLVTGTSGFLGNIIYHELKRSHEVFALGRNRNADFHFDITATVPPLPFFDMVVHAAGKAHSIPRSTRHEQEFFDVNVNGTRNLLAALESNPPSTFVFISSVAVYGLEHGDEIDESYPLLAATPYGKSKIAAEKIVAEWGKQMNVNTVILRLPLVAGPHPPGNLREMMNAVQKGFYFRIGKGEARRSVVSAKDVARFLPRLLNHEGTYNLSGSTHPSIAEIDSILGKVLNKKIRAIPYRLARLLALAGDLLPLLPFNTDKLKKLTRSLTFSSRLVRSSGDWAPAAISEDTFLSN